MKIKNNKILRLSALAGIISVGVLASGYSILNKDVTIVVGGEERSVSTFKSNVKELLEEQNIKYDGNDIISVKLETKLSDGDKIEVIDVTEETIIESKEVPFEVDIVEDSTLLKGDSTVATEGEAGMNELVYKVTYHNGEKVEKTFVEEVTAKEPINKVIKKGTKVEVQIASSRGESSRNQATGNSSTSNREHMSVVATAYTGDGITSTGTTPKWGTIAVDPSIIPYGTKVYIPQFNMTFIAEDTGSAIKGNKIDIFMTDETKVKNWGRKTIDIYVIG